MTEWWNSLSDVLRMLYCIAIPATLILVIQTVMSLAGSLEGGEGIDTSDTSGLDHSNADLDTSTDADFDDLRHTTDGSAPGDASAMHMLTMQTIVAFLTVFSWSTIASIHSGSSSTISILLGLVLGIAAMFLVAKLVQLSAKLVENGTLNPHNAIGENAQVYLPISGHGGMPGKVMLHIQGRLTEYGAITHGAPIETGAQVRVIDLRGDLLVVERAE